jgi:hypothetical protein
MNNILFFYSGVPSPIFETELELIKIHALKGDRIRVLICDGELSNCFWNPEKKKYICRQCISKRENGFKLLKNFSNIEYVYFKTEKLDLKFDNIKSVYDLKSFNYDGVNIGLGVASRLLSLFRDHRFNFNENIDQIYRELSTSIEGYNNLKFHIEDFKPKIGFIFNGRVTVFHAATLIFKKYGIEYQTYETAQNKNKYLLRTNSNTFDIQYFHNECDALWQSNKNFKEREKIAKEWFSKKINGADIAEGKMETFVSEQIKSTLPDNFNYKKKNIAVFNSTIDEFYYVDGWKNQLYEPDQTEGLRQTLVDFLNFNDYVFYLRVHPNMRTLPKSTSQLNDIQELDKDFNNLVVIWPEEKIDSYELLRVCHKVLVYGSTIGIESAYLNKPTILAARALYENFDCVYTPKNHQQLIKLLKTKNLPPLDSKSALKYGYREMMHGIDFKYFKEEGVKNTLSYGKFDGHRIKPHYVYRINFLFNIFLDKIKNLIK